MNANNWDKFPQDQPCALSALPVDSSDRIGERLLYRLLESSTFTKFIDSDDRDKFYKTEIEANKKFKRIQLFI